MHYPCKTHGVLAKGRLWQTQCTTWCLRYMLGAAALLCCLEACNVYHYCSRAFKARHRVLYAGNCLRLQSSHTSK